MSEYDAETYDRFSNSVRRQVQSLRVILDSLQVKNIPRPRPLHNTKPASMAQLDAPPTGDQEVMGSTPAEVGNILSWRLI